MRCLLITAVAALLAGLAATATAAFARGWVRPVDGSVVRAFSVGPDRYAAGQHRGVDLAAAPGSRVRAACAGRVRFAGRVPGGGRTVSVRCGALVATYQRLGSVAVAPGQVVMAGEPIGRAGNARRSPHVHLGARVAATGDYRDPAGLFAAGPGAPGAPLPLLRRAPPAGPAPGARPLARPLGPAPARVRAPAPLALPMAPRAPALMPAGAGAARRLPWPVWLGLALVALGLPLGGGLLVAGRRRRAAIGLGETGRRASPGSLSGR